MGELDLLISCVAAVDVDKTIDQQTNDDAFAVRRR